MQIKVFIEQRFIQSPDGAILTQVAFSRSFWDRYLAVFDAVVVVARVQCVNAVPDGWLRADGDKVTFIRLPYYVGPMGYLKKNRAILHCTKTAVRSAEALLLRVPSQIAWSIQPILETTSRPYAVEVVGDPWDVFAPGVVALPLRWIFRRLFRHQLRRQCAMSAASAYVTEDALQKRYPPSPRGVSTHYSSVELPLDAFIRNSRKILLKNVWRLIFVGSLEQLYKGPDVLLIACEKLVREGSINLCITFVGDGKYRPMLQEMASKAGLLGMIEFVGQLTAGEVIRHRLDNADLFVLPSKTEGLPRALIEAMARGLPCVGSNVGGIPELLPDEDLVPVGNADALAAKIKEVLSDPDRMARMSERNLLKSRSYCDEVLSARRTAFYNELKQITAIWMTDRSPI